MVQFKTYDEIMSDMLNRVDDRYDKREGSMIYTALAPAARELAQAYIALEWLSDESNPATASRDGLLRLAGNRGLFPFDATQAVYRGEFSLPVPIGTRFNAGDVNFVVFELLENNQALLRCEVAGSQGNGLIGDIYPIDFISGLTLSRLVELVAPAEDEEDTERFRQRYFESLNAQAFGGNVAQYRDEVNRIDGVGGVKVYPHWAGPGTVKVVIVAADYTQSTSELLAPTVQTALDPEPGLGYGIAPIGHQVAVDPIESLTVDITMQVTPESGYVWADVLPEINGVIDNYFKELAETWQDQTTIVVRRSEIESRVLGVPGILDVDNSTLNGLTSNLALGENEIPVRGAVSNT